MKTKEHIEKAVNRAVKAGYKDHAYCNEFDMYECSSLYCHSTVLLDVDFWKALEKAEGWNTVTYRERANEVLYYSAKDFEPTMIEAHRYYMFRLMDWIADGKEIDLYFKELLKNEN